MYRYYVITIRKITNNWYNYSAKYEKNKNIIIVQIFFKYFILSYLKSFFL